MDVQGDVYRDRVDVTARYTSLSRHAYTTAGLSAIVATYRYRLATGVVYRDISSTIATEKNTVRRECRVEGTRFY